MHPDQVCAGTELPKVDHRRGACEGMSRNALSQRIEDFHPGLLRPSQRDRDRMLGRVRRHDERRLRANGIGCAHPRCQVRAPEPASEGGRDDGAIG